MKKFCSRLSVQNALAQDCLIAGIFEDANAEFQELLKKGDISPKPLMVCSGGTSSRCTANGHWTLDLRKKYKKINFDLTNNTVEIGAGITMGDLVEELKKYRRSFPIGLSGLPGIGYILTGGISPLSRSQGLAIDQILKINGVWGKGESFEISKPKASSCTEDQLIWKGLCGAAPFLGIVTELTLETHPQTSLTVWKGHLNKTDLIQAIRQAEYWPDFMSLQWIWSSKIEVFVVITHNANEEENTIKKLRDKFPSSKTLKVFKVSSLNDLPAFRVEFTNKKNNHHTHSEVIGLLGPSWENNCSQIIDLTTHLMSNRPNENCYIACQQLGKSTTKSKRESTSFIHRNSMWKPWITASWEAKDTKERERSLFWLKEVWEALAPHCPGIHLAQMHQHLPWHNQEAQKAFEEWLPGLQKLKSEYDPHGILPRL